MPDVEARPLRSGSSTFIAEWLLIEGGYTDLKPGKIVKIEGALYELLGSVSFLDMTVPTSWTLRRIKL